MCFRMINVLRKNIEHCPCVVSIKQKYRYFKFYSRIGSFLKVIVVYEIKAKVKHFWIHNIYHISLRDNKSLAG